MEQFGIQVDACIHGNVLHVFQAADDLYVFEPGHDRVRGLVNGLQARSAQPVHRGAARMRGQSRHDAYDPRGVHPLLALLLRVAQHHVLDLQRIDARAFHQGFDHLHGQVVGSDFAKHALVFVCAANGRANAVDNHGAFHRKTSTGLNVGIGSGK